jgi:LEA14-like dessication related protein
MVKLILLFFLTVALGFFFKEPEFIDARNFALQSVGLKKSTIYSDLYYFNPNGFGLQMKKADLDIYINNRFVGHALVDTMINIPKLDTFSIPVNLEVDMKSIFPNALSLLFNDEIDLKIDGTAKVGKSGLFMNIPVKYEGKQSIR